MDLIATVNPENISETEMETYEQRTCARAVVFDEERQIAILNVSTMGYHMLPGGEKEPGEDIDETLYRECVDEIGCDIEIIAELGRIIDVHAVKKVVTESFCYMAKIIGEKGEPTFSQKEQDCGFQTQWFPFERAYQIIDSDDPEDYSGKCIVARDRLILQKAEQLMD